MKNLVKTALELAKLLLTIITKILNLLISPVQELTKGEEDSENFEGTMLKGYKYQAINTKNLDDDEEDFFIDKNPQVNFFYIIVFN